MLDGLIASAHATDENSNRIRPIARMESCRRVRATAQDFSGVKPRSTRRRIASLRDSMPLDLAHLSTAAVSSLGNRKPIIGSRPVAGLPGPFLFGLAAIDLAIILV